MTEKKTSEETLANKAKNAEDGGENAGSTKQAVAKQVDDSTQASNASVGWGGYFSELDLESVELSLEGLFKAGAHFGHKKSRTNPKMNDFIYTVRDGISIIDLKRTLEEFNVALGFIDEITAKGGNVLFVGTKRHVKTLVASAARRVEAPYIVERWLGGIFTNYSVFRRRVQYMNDLRKKIEDDELGEFTKFERLKKMEELEKLEGRIGGLKDLLKLPDAVFVADVKHDILAIKEANRIGIPVVAIVDANDDPESVDYPIPANNDAISSLKYIFSNVCKAYLSGKAKYVPTANLEAEKAPKKESGNAKK